VIEGAGGVLVPLDRDHLMIDLMVRLGLPVVLVARSGLGTINHHAAQPDGAALRAISPSLAWSSSARPIPATAPPSKPTAPSAVIAELPPVEPLDATALAGLAANLPPFAELLR